MDAEKMSKTRVAVTSLAISAALIASIGINEGWTERPVIPVQGDVPTIYNGITSNPYTGQAVKMTDDSWTLCQMGDAKACGRKLLYGHLVTKDTGLKKCLKPTTLMTQGEYDILLDFSYQYGVAATCKSSMVRHYNVDQPTAACKSYLRYKFSQGYDCSTPGNKICSGVWTRSVLRYNSCMNEQRVN